MAKTNVVKIFEGPSYYLKSRAAVIDAELDINVECALDAVKDRIRVRFPAMSVDGNNMAELFCELYIYIQKLEMDLFPESWYVIDDNKNKFKVAVEYLCPDVCVPSANLAAEILEAEIKGQAFDHAPGFNKITEIFNASMYGGPTIYSILEAAHKRKIPMFLLKREDSFQWGYGINNVYGRSTTFSTDGIKATEFTTHKDLVKEFIRSIGVPTPEGDVCRTLDEGKDTLKKLGFPIVVKPVDGHKGEGVKANINDFEDFIESVLRVQIKYGRAIVEKHTNGFDHRLLCVNKKFAAALQRVPAYVDGDGVHTIKELVDMENATEARIDNARSPLGKIKIDDDLLKLVKAKGFTMASVPESGQRLYLRKIANLSAGGVSINVTDKIHPENVKMAEMVARYFQLHCLGIDILSEDISVPWYENNASIIEINAAPGIFMHLRPALGGSIDVPGIIIDTMFTKRKWGRIPIIATNKVTTESAKEISRWAESHGFKSPAFVNSDGLFVNDELFCKNVPRYDAIKNLLRDPVVDFALLEYDGKTIMEHGLRHIGSDIVVLDSPSEEEKILSRDVVEDGIVIIEEKDVDLNMDTNKLGVYSTEEISQIKGKYTAGIHNDNLIITYMGERILQRAHINTSDKTALKNMIVKELLKEVMKRHFN